MRSCRCCKRCSHTLLSSANTHTGKYWQTRATWHRGLPCWKTWSEKSLKIPKGQSESVYRRRKDNRKSTKGQTTISNDDGYVPLVVSTSRYFTHSRFITGFVTRLTLRMSLVGQEVLTRAEHLSSPATVKFSKWWLQLHQKEPLVQ
jgi:hypothetical protein